MSSSVFTSEIDGLRPRPGASLSNPSTPRVTNRRSHRITAGRLTPNSAAGRKLRLSRRTCQHNPRPAHDTLSSRRRVNQTLQLAPLNFAQIRGGSGFTRHAEQQDDQITVCHLNNETLH